MRGTDSKIYQMMILLTKKMTNIWSEFQSFRIVVIKTIYKK